MRGRKVAVQSGIAGQVFTRMKEWFLATSDRADRLKFAPVPAAGAAARSGGLPDLLPNNGRGVLFS
jgi:hypothetical protein